MSGSEQRKTNGTFAKGNTLGKAPRRKLPKTMIRKVVSNDEAIEMLESGLEQARSGDQHWQTWFLNRLFPVSKPVSPPLDVKIDFTDMKTGLLDILSKTATGKISTDQAKDLLAATQSVFAITELAELREEIESLHKLMEGNHERFGKTKKAVEVQES